MKLKLNDQEYNFKRLQTIIIIILSLFSTVLKLLRNDMHLNRVHSRGDQMRGVQHKLPIETASLEQRIDEYW